MKTEKKNNSAMRKLIPATSMLLVSAMMLASSTYAWFTMNKEVEVTGLTMKTKVSSNLLISSNNVEGTYKADRLVEERKALLEPVSTTTGRTDEFWYTLDSAENGSKAHSGTAIPYVKYNEKKSGTGANTNSTAAAAGKYYYDDTFSKAYGVEPASSEFGTAYGYIDYVFYLKATGDTDNQELRMTACDLNYDYASGTTAHQDPPENAWRVAVFSTDITANGGKGNTGSGDAIGRLDPAGSGTTATTILKPSGSDNFTTGNAVSSASSLSSVTYGTAAVLDADIDAGVTKYYKVLVRAWIEGEDTTCNTKTYAQLTDQWSLDLEFKLTNSGSSSSGETAVTQITKNIFTPSITDTQSGSTSPIDVNRSEGS